MLGLMQSQPLLISSLVEFADRHYVDGEIVFLRVGGYSLPVAGCGNAG
jgi:3-(methylthio)propionyl---CoA ligase